MPSGIYCIGYEDFNDLNNIKLIFSPVIKDNRYLDFKPVAGLFNDNDFVKYVYHWIKDLRRMGMICNFSKIFDELNYNVVVSLSRIGNIKKMNNNAFNKNSVLVRRGLLRKKMANDYVINKLDNIFFFMQTRNIHLDFYNYEYELFESVEIGSLYFIMMKLKIDNQNLKRFRKIYIIYESKIFSYICDFIPLGE
jgi:hypothetical protein